MGLGPGTCTLLLRLSPLTKGHSGSFNPGGWETEFKNNFKHFIIMNTVWHKKIKKKSKKEGRKWVQAEAYRLEKWSTGESDIQKKEREHPTQQEASRLGAADRTPNQVGGSGSEAAAMTT